MLRAGVNASICASVALINDQASRFLEQDAGIEVLADTIMDAVSDVLRVEPRTCAVLVTFVPACAAEPVWAVAAGAIAEMSLNFSLSRSLVFR